MKYRYIASDGSEETAPNAAAFGRAVAEGRITSSTLVFDGSRWVPASALDIFLATTATTNGEASTKSVGEVSDSVSDQPPPPAQDISDRSRAAASTPTSGSIGLVVGLVLLILLSLGTLGGSRDGPLFLGLTLSGAGVAQLLYWVVGFRVSKRFSHVLSWAASIIGSLLAFAFFVAFAEPGDAEALASAAGIGMGLGLSFGIPIALVVGALARRAKTPAL